MNRLFERGITVRNQSRAAARRQRHASTTMQLLVKRLGHVNVHPYYVYVHDLVKGVEDLRTTLQTALDIEKHVRGVDRRLQHADVRRRRARRRRQARRALVRALRPRDRHLGVHRAGGEAGQFFLYFDPIALLPPEGQARWADPREQRRMVEDAIAAAVAAAH